MDIPIYCVNYKNEERKTRMCNRFLQIGITLKFVNEVNSDDSRINYDINIGTKRVWAIMLQHLDCIRDFYENTDKQYCIVCEDDILISKDYPIIIDEIVNKFEELQLDILLLGYLLPFKISKTEMNQQYFKILSSDKNNFTYHSYPDDIWGTQMYLISREYAYFLLNKYTPEYAFTNINTLNYSPDWIISKNGNRAIINNMVAVEEGINVSDDYSQQYFHKRCYECNYDPNKFI